MNPIDFLICKLLLHFAVAQERQDGIALLLGPAERLADLIEDGFAAGCLLSGINRINQSLKIVFQVVDLQLPASADTSCVAMAYSLSLGFRSCSASAPAPTGAGA